MNKQDKNLINEAYNKIHEAMITMGPGANDRVGSEALKIMISNAVSEFLTRSLPRALSVKNGLSSLDTPVRLMIIKNVIQQLQQYHDHVKKP